MQAITHLHKPSTQLQAVVLPSFLDADQPCLCIVKHSSLDFLALPTVAGVQGSTKNGLPTPSPLTLLASAEFNARILRVTPAQGHTRLAVLTDHHNPRLLLLRCEKSRHADGKTSYAAVVDHSVLLTEMARPAAELGLGVWTAKGAESEALVAHTHAGNVRVLSLGAGRKRVAAAAPTQSYALNLPHPSMISLAPLDLPDPPSPSPSIALLSISSSPSRIPGLGTQCLPVLSFHSIDDARQELAPMPWGPERKVPPLVKEATGDIGEGGASHRRTSTSSDARPSRSPHCSSSNANASSGRAGPSAMGRTLTAAQARAREQSLAKTALTRSHVTLPFADALGAHLLTALPRDVGGSVIVWSETSVLVVTPPVPDLASGAAGPLVGTPGKRRKASGTVPKTIAEVSTSRRSSTAKKEAGVPDATEDTDDHAMLSTSPSSRANEHGKRRRASVKAATSPPTSPAAEELTLPSTPAVSDHFEGLRILRLNLPRPIQVAAATVVGTAAADASPVLLNESGTRATIHVLFGTAAGQLNDLEIVFTRADSTSLWAPHNMRATRVGKIPRPSGPESLCDLGEGFVHVASASGDSAIVQLVPNSQDKARELSTEDAEMVSLPPDEAVYPAKSSTERRNISSASQQLSNTRPLADLPASTSQLLVVHTFPSLAPILDFVIDGDANASLGGTQARVVAACGTGPDGAIAVVKTGVALQELGALSLGQAKRLWTIVQSSGDVLLVCGFADHTRVLSIGAAGVTDLTDTLSAGTVSSSRTLAASAVAGAPSWVHVSDSQLTVYDASSSQQTVTWEPSVATPKTKACIVACSVFGTRALLALRGGQLLLLRLSGEAIDVLDSVTVTDEVASMDAAHGIAVIGQWGSNSLKFFLMDGDQLEDVTPSTMGTSNTGIGGLPVSCALHRFSQVGSNDQAPVHLLVGLSTGTLASWQLSPPTPDSFSKVMGLHDRKTTSLGRKPVQLTPFKTSLGKNAILATNGDAATAIWANRAGHLSLSALSHSSISAAAPLCLPRADPAVILALPESLSISAIRDIGQLEITKFEMGIDNPSAIAGLKPDSRGYHAHFAVLTNPFRPEGNATRQQRKSQVVLLESSAFEKVAAVALESNERANCVTAVNLRGTEVIVVGTGFVKPDETETTDGRLLMFTASASASASASATDSAMVELRQCYERHVNGNVYAVVGAAGKVLCAINSEVLSFGFTDESSDMEVEDAGVLAGKIGCLSRWGCAFIACALSPVADDPCRVVVGDALRSLCVLDVNADDGSITEIARDCDPFWTSASAALDSATQTFIGADISFNLYTSQRAKLSPETRRRIEREEERRRERVERGDATAAAPSSNAIPLPPRNEDWSHVMERRGAWHYGDLVNRMQEGCLVNKTASLLTSTKTEGGLQATRRRVDPRLVFATASGALAVVSSLDEDAGKVLSQVERNLRAYLQPLGGISHEEWRTLRTDHRKSEAAGFLDGELLMQFVSALSREDRLKVLEGDMDGCDRVTATIDEVNELLVDGIGRTC
ncbi:unnamed protein product [Parajaminaea phylloscopi]